MSQCCFPDEETLDDILREVFQFKSVCISIGNELISTNIF